MRVTTWINKGKTLVNRDTTFCGIGLRLDPSFRFSLDAKVFEEHGYDCWLQRLEIPAEGRC